MRCDCTCHVRIVVYLAIAAALWMPTAEAAGRAGGPVVVLPDELFVQSSAGTLVVRTSDGRWVEGIPPAAVSTRIAMPLLYPGEKEHHLLVVVSGDTGTTLSAVGRDELGRDVARIALDPMQPREIRRIYLTTLFDAEQARNVRQVDFEVPGGASGWQIVIDPEVDLAILPAISFGHDQWWVPVVEKVQDLPVDEALGITNWSDTIATVRLTLVDSTHEIVMEPHTIQITARGMVRIGLRDLAPDLAPGAAAIVIESDQPVATYVQFESSFTRGRTAMLGTLGAQTEIGDHRVVREEQGDALLTEPTGFSMTHVELPAVTAIEEDGLRKNASASCLGYSSPGNPFDCCTNDQGAQTGNCTWWVWKMVRDTWGEDYPARGDARTFAEQGYPSGTTPLPNSIAVRTQLYSPTAGRNTGHVAWVVSTQGSKVYVSEMNCGDDRVYLSKERDASWFDVYVYPRGSFIESFEDNTAQWTSEGSGLWHRTQRRSQSGSSSYWYGRESSGNYDLSGQAHQGSLISPTFSLNVDSRLLFSSYHETETGLYYDQKFVEISLNNGPWQQLSQIGGSMRTWQNIMIPLRGYRGQARLRFRFDTRDGLYNQFFGWAIDNVMVMPDQQAIQPTPTPAPDFTLSVSPLSLTVQQGSTASVNIELRGLNNFSGMVRLDASNLPSGAAAGSGFEQGSVSVPQDGTSRTTFRLVTNGGTAAGSHSITLRATSSGITKAATVAITVQAKPSLPPPIFVPITWNFNTYEGWSPVNMAATAISGGILFMDPAGNDPYIVGPEIWISGTSHQYVNMRMARNCSGPSAIYFKTNQSNYYSEDKKVSFDVPGCMLCGNAPFVVKSVWMGAHSKWTANTIITGVRLDPCDYGSGSTNKDSVGLDWLQISPTP